MLLNCGAGETLESSLNCKGLKPVNPKGNQSWIFIGRTDTETEPPILWAPDVKNWLIGKDPDAGKDWRQEEKGTTEDKMVGWHHWLYGHEFEQALGVGDEQGSLVCCSPWGPKSWTWLSDWTELNTAPRLLVLTRLCVCPAYLSWYGLFILSCRKSVLLVLRLFSERVVLYAAVILVCLWGEVSSGASYSAILIWTLLLSFYLELLSLNVK